MKVGFINVNAPRDSVLRNILWADIESLVNSVNAVWIIFGDFNVVRRAEEIAGSLFDLGEANSFKEEHTSRPQFFSSLFRKLSNSDASFLELSISLDEVKEALWSFASSKSPGPNGINFYFIKSYWDVLKSTFWDCVKCFEASGSFSKGCNPLFIVLILKKSDPLGFSDYSPVSLIGCVYKVISKILAIWLAKMDHLKDRKLLLFKGDFEKAFDSVNWNFSLMS
ncbi:hypothetical protein Tco_0600546 [Tanacetum coccineum]